jgi:ketosteroid isomerase-like protein
MNSSAHSILTPKAVVAFGMCLILAQTACQRGPSEPAAVQPPSRDVEQDEQAVIAAHQALIHAYQSADVDAFTRLLASSPDLLIFHPRLESRFDGVDEVKQSMGRMFERLSKATWSDHHAIVRVEGDAAWLTSHVQIESAGMKTPFVGRGTEIWVRQPEGWRLVHGHWSENPEIGR